ncbi:hypothetical protein V5T82_16175 [Magnetovibrio sp. PR-2]|uniref:hypothetical protein n=1 Tax=Magnetovibrio sp. PR-2 TaxID=3120356 RepID=UPI002FCDF15D
MSTWSYVAVEGSQADDAERNMLNAANGLDTAQRETCKISASDMRGKDARAVCFYDSDGDSFEGVMTTTFQMEIVSTSTDYDRLYSDAAKFLNSLSPKQAQNARVTFTNASHNDATIAIYYPASV